jgi:protein tyrosine/serine phosphatase
MSVIHHPHEPLNRHIPFTSVFNFRDLGGYRTRDQRTTRWRRLYRSSEMQRMTEDEATYARETLGVRMVIDLRQPQIVASDGTGPLAAKPVHYVNISVYPERVLAGLEQARRTPLALAEDYLRRFRQPAFAAGMLNALKLIAAQDDGATVFHCAAGKDRAGKLAAIILGVLGVCDDQIVRDYALSAVYMPRQIDHWWVHDPPSSPYFSKLPRYMYDARPETMADVLHTIRHEYGSMRGYVEAHGGTPDLFQRLEDCLLEA